jgi:hypothetical protein
VDLLAASDVQPDGLADHVRWQRIACIPQGLFEEGRGVLDVPAGQRQVREAHRV